MTQTLPAKRVEGGRSDLRWLIGALAPGETLEIPADGLRWEALNSARKRASQDTGLKYRTGQYGDNYLVLAYDPNDGKPSLAALVKPKVIPASVTEDRLREIVREIVREELSALR
jgi:hypothetical protein